MPPDHDRAALAVRLLALLEQDDVDAALAAGLMDYRPQAGDAALDPRLPAALAAAQQRLRRAWAARDRYRQHQLRQARRAAEREARRRAAAPPPAVAGTAALPPAVAAALARAKARAGIAKP